MFASVIGVTHRSLWMRSTVVAKVGALESLGTVSSSWYPGLPLAAAYWASTTSSTLTGAMDLITLTFSSRMSSALPETGFSMAIKARICSSSTAVGEIRLGEGR